MSKGLRNTLIGIGVVVLSAALVWTGVILGRASLGPWSMMDGFISFPSDGDLSPYGWMMGPGGMHGHWGDVGPYAGGFMGPGMMGAGMMGPGGSAGLFGVEPLSLDTARKAVQGYLEDLGDEDLALGEVMAFDNHAYAQIVEKSTGIGAMEVLVDPVTLAVYPEHGPNMMWNRKYSPMARFGGFWMMGERLTGEVSAEMPVTPEQAVKSAQRYLDLYLPGAQADEQPDPFYGYYTLHILRDGETVGMLSVDGYTRQVFVHTWHGTLLEMAEGA